MREYTQKELNHLISCPKIIDELPKNEMIMVKGSLCNDMRLRSIDEKHNFYVFMRKNLELQMNFSVGLIYKPGDHPEEIPLLRCNSCHGFIKDCISENPHFNTHIHYINAEDLNSGIRKPNRKEITTDYTTFEGAVVCFLTKVNIQNVEASNYLVSLKQNELFGTGGF